METAISNTLGVCFDRGRAESAWLESLPAPIRQKLLGPRELRRALDSLERCLNDPAPPAFAEFAVEVHRLAYMLQSRFGHEAALRYLRGGLAQALAPCVGACPESASLVWRLLSDAGDAVWRAYADSLQTTIRYQENERLHQELLLAKRIQERLLPRKVPEVPGFDIAGTVLPAAEVGGDYWSCKIYPEDDIVTFKLADVTGHGVAAATLVAAVKFISGGYYRAAKTAAQVMERTNRVLVQETPNEIMVTMVYGWLYPHSNAVSIVNAGHTPVLHFHDGEFRSIAPTGPALGMIESRYREVRLDLAPGDMFITCSDGVTEPAAGQALGEEWLRDQIRLGAALPAADLVDQILSNALAAYGLPLDDMSLLVIRRLE
jgi:hypothetical protein